MVDCFFNKMYVSTEPTYTFFLDSSNCSDAQLMYHDLSSRLMEKAYKKFEPNLRSRISSCQSDPSWINPNSNRYKKCTKEIGFSSGLKLEDLDIVEIFVAHNIIFEIPSDVQIGQLMEGLHPLESKGIQKAMQYINQSTYSYKNKHSCGKK